MSGILILLVMMALVGAGCWFAGVRRGALTALLAALAFGGAGYVMQGRPDLAGDPREAMSVANGLPLAGARSAFFGNFGANDSWLMMADSLAARGKLGDAANVLASAVREHPKDSHLWIGLGNALVDQAGVLTPPARFAYEEAARLAPNHPAPDFFLGLAEVRSQNPAEAERLWRALLADAPPNAQWRPLVEQGLNAIGADAQAPTPTE